MNLFAGDSFWPVIIFTVVLFGLFYLLAIRPQRKRQKQHQEMLAELQKGAKVMTAGGIHGIIESVDEESMVLRVESGATIRFARGSIVTKVGD